MPGTARLVAPRAPRGAVDGSGGDATEGTAFAAELGSVATVAGAAQGFTAAAVAMDRALPTALAAPGLMGALPACPADPATGDPMPEPFGRGVTAAVQTPRNTNVIMTGLGEQRGQDEHGDRNVRGPRGQRVGMAGQVRIKAAQGELARRGHHHLGRGSDVHPSHHGDHPLDDTLDHKLR